MALSKRAKAIAVAAGTVLILAIIFIALSVASVGPTELGLAYNLNTFQIDETRLYTPGRYFLGFNQVFIIFPSDTQYVKFDNSISLTSESMAEPPTAPSLLARTFDGLRVDLSLSFQYRLRQNVDDVVNLYKNFSTEYQDTYVRFARDVVRNVAADFRAFAFFEERNLVELRMKEQLNARLSEVGANVDSFDLLNFNLPTNFTNAIQDTEVARQDIQKAEFEKQKIEISSTTRIQEARLDAQREVVARNATGEVRLQETEASIALNSRHAGYAFFRRKLQQAQEIRAVLNESKLANMELKNQLQFNASDLLTFLWTQSLRDHETEKVLLDVEKPLLSQWQVDNAGSYLH